MFEHLEAYAGDPIFRLGEEFYKDPRSQKVNLTVGLYYDNEEQIPLLETIRTTEARLAADPQPRPYLPLEGLATYRSAVQKLLFGEDHEVLRNAKVATIQSIGGTGALKVGGDFLHDAYPDSDMWISDPAWENHFAIFQGAGIKTHSYPYYDPETGGLLFEQMLAKLRQLPKHSIVLLHACCHNPTGVDLSHEQWLQLIPVLVQGQLIPFVDIAYQGFGQGLQEDAFAVRALADAGLSFLVASSFSKNFSFYAERCGGLSVVCSSKDEAGLVLGQLKAIARRIYSNPPAHGGQATAMVLNDPQLYAQWEQEVAQMRERIASMRQIAHQLLSEKLPSYDSSYLVTQQGMFSYTGLSKAQIKELRDKHGVYILESGRMSVPGLNTHNIDYFTDAMASVLRNAA